MGRWAQYKKKFQKTKNKKKTLFSYLHKSVVQQQRWRRGQPISEESSKSGPTWTVSADPTLLDLNCRKERRWDKGWEWDHGCRVALVLLNMPRDSINVNLIVFHTLLSMIQLTRFCLVVYFANYLLICLGLDRLQGWILFCSPHVHWCSPRRYWSLAYFP